MTIFGPDISSFQSSLDLAQLRSASFVIAKTTEGTYYTDADYQGWRAQAGRLGLPFLWYHFLSGEDPAAQVAHTLANVGDHSLPGMLDVEPEKEFRPSLRQLLDYADAAAAAGLNLKLAYLPYWYWVWLGSPDLTPLADRGLHLVASGYPGGTGTPEQLYPGDTAGRWQAYGGMTPLLYQYTNQATDGGKPLDYNAFRGTLTELLTTLGATTMGTIPPSISAKWPELAGDFPANGPFTDETALIYADAGARAAALYAQQALAEIRALAAKIAAPPVPPPAVPPVDIDALAAALAPRLQAGITAGTPAPQLSQEVAHETLMHLAAVIQAGEPAIPAAG